MLHRFDNWIQDGVLGHQDQQSVVGVASRRTCRKLLGSGARSTVVGVEHLSSCQNAKGGTSVRGTVEFSCAIDCGLRVGVETPPGLWCSSCDYLGYENVVVPSGNQ